MTHLRIVGDVHGWTDRYTREILSDEVQYSIQIGDLGFQYEDLNRLPYKRHKFFGGNHDNYDIYYKSPHSLGDFGAFNLGKLSFYFIRGAYSIDHKGRMKAERRGHPKCWWKEEQLPLPKRYEAFEDYVSRKPRTMLTHTCPTEIAKLIGNPKVLESFGFNPNKFTTPTQELLQQCFDKHRPEVWIFGHFHKDLTFYHKDTLFICLREAHKLGYIDIDSKGKFNHNGFQGRLGQ